jgi:hypothetical protein
MNKEKEDLLPPELCDPSSPDYGAGTNHRIFQDGGFTQPTTRDLYRRRWGFDTLWNWITNRNER